MAGKLEGKTAIVTGAGRGIGRGVALLMAQEGARVLVVDNGSLVNGVGSDPEVANRVVEEIRERGGDALANTGDVAETAEANGMVAQALDAWGRVDILVNAAGNYRLATIVDILDEDWDPVIRTHLQGTMATTRAAARHWIETGGPGRVVNFTSLAGTGGLPGMVAYSTAKAGIIGLTRATANALAHYNVTANSISPNAATRMSDRGGWQRSGETTDANGKWAREVAEGPRLASNVAPLVVYLSSDAAAGVSGRIFGARGWEYTLITENIEERHLWSDGPWNLDRLFDQFPTTLGQGLSLDSLPHPLDEIEGRLEEDFPHEELG